MSEHIKMPSGIPLTEEQKRKIREESAEKFLAQLAHEMGISREAVRQVLKADRQKDNTA